MTDPALRSPDRPSARSGSSRTGRGRALHGAVLVAAGAAATLSVWPRILGVSGLPVVAQVVSFRGAVAVACTLVVVALVAGPWRRRTMAVACVLAVGLAGQFTVITARGTSVGRIASPGDLVVMTYNTAGTWDAAGLAQAVVGAGARIVVLPETEEHTARATARMLADLGRSAQVLSVGQGLAATSLLVDQSLGTWRVDEVLDLRWGSFVARPVGEAPDGAPAAIVAVHPLSPPMAVGRTADWRRDTRAAVALCTRIPGAIVAGDFNATGDHPAFGALGSCRDAASQAGAGSTGTWPTLWPAAMGAVIDHVLVDPAAWRVTGARVEEHWGIGSDHRALVVRLRPTG